ncbi:DNA cytosine methyltransferase [Catellatospora sp. NPDC049609]|uniref:DNA cytosine methyltransferase n=1 Tax=Catellatospora sp. NPDC049609 TaxID=3155505 RepID=UPI003428DFBD
MLTFTDIFCGAGGSSIGLHAAGLELKLAANHWDRAIETHAANFRDAEHVCADVNNYDMRRLPSTDILWASPICTEVSPAGGRRAKTRPAPGQGDLLEAFGPVSADAFTRTRATFWDVIRATEVHRYQAVLIENVPDVDRWELFDHWVSGMVLLGYNVQYVSVSSAHIGGDGNPYAPQWRDRLYLVFTRKGIPLPDVEPRPLAWCQACGVNVDSRQAWKQQHLGATGARKVGKYRRQYVYVCPERGHTVEPYVLPAAAAIDWTDLGTRIGDRATPLAAKTMARIEAGLRMFADHRTLITVNHDGDGRALPLDRAPLPTRTVKIGEGVATPPMLVPAGGTWNDTAAGVLDEPMRTRTAREAEAIVSPEPFIAAAAGHTYERPGSGYVRAWPAGSAPLNTRTGTAADGVVIPPVYVKQYGGYADPANMTKDTTTEPLGAMTTSDSHSLVTSEPFITVLRNHGDAHGIDDPLRTMAAGGGHHGLAVPGSFLTLFRSGRIRNTNPGTDPLATIVTSGSNHALVIPYRRANRPTTTGEPLHTMSTRDSGALVQPAIDVDDCWFRMLKPREQLRAQCFPDTYTVLGNVGEQTKQAGNAVSANVAQWLGGRVVAALAATSAVA